MKKSKKFLTVSAILVLALSTVYFIPEKRKEIKTPHFDLRFSSSIDTATIVKLADALENSYSRIGKNLETTPSDNIEANVYAQRWRYIKATGNWGASGSIEGISKLHFVGKA